jgi:hypothetical protein
VRICGCCKSVCTGWPPSDSTIGRITANATTIEPAWRQIDRMAEPCNISHTTRPLTLTLCSHSHTAVKPYRALAASVSPRSPRKASTSPLLLLHGKPVHRMTSSRPNPDGEGWQGEGIAGEHGCYLSIPRESQTAMLVMGVSLAG